MSNAVPHTPDAVLLPFPRRMTDEEWLALSCMFAFCERDDAPENIKEAARVMREVLR